VFACPVARDQSSPDNPPMILPCGCVEPVAPTGNAPPVAYLTAHRSFVSRPAGLCCASSPSRSLRGATGACSSAPTARCAPR
jgi:hypothetical protein